MNEEQAKALRAPFDESLICALPKITCQNCSRSQSKNCDQHQKSKCRVCGSWITSAHTHLSYVGHAETTDRLLSVDPEWTWEPVAFAPNGLPLLDNDGGLWMRLTIGGVTRLGYGDAQGKNGPNAVKEAIGDGIRNAAMRFGVALDLWAKSDLAAIHADKETGEIAGQAEPRQQSRPADPPAEPQEQSRPAGTPEPPPADVRAARSELWEYAQSKGMKMPQVEKEFARFTQGVVFTSASAKEVRDFMAFLKRDFEESAA